MEDALDRHPACRREPRPTAGPFRQRGATWRGWTRCARAYDPDGLFHPGWDGPEAMSEPSLAPYLSRPLAPADPGVLAAIAAGPMDPAEAVPLGRFGRLLDPAPLPVETGWCSSPDRIGYVAVRTEIPGVTGPDGRVVVRLAPARPGPLPDLAPDGAPRQLARGARRSQAPSRIGAPCTIRSRTWASGGHARSPFSHRARSGSRVTLWTIPTLPRSSAATSATTAAACATR